MAETGMGSNQIDVVDNGAIVKVFLLEGTFPSNTPNAILDSAGSFWESFGERVMPSVKTFPPLLRAFPAVVWVEGSVVFLLSVDSAFRLVSSDYHFVIFHVCCMVYSTECRVLCC